MGDFLETLWGVSNPTDCDQRPLRPVLDSLIKGFNDNAYRLPSNKGNFNEFYDLYKVHILTGKGRGRLRLELLIIARLINALLY